MWLGLSGRFRARWSPQIHDEWKRNLLINRSDLTSAQLDRTSGLQDSCRRPAKVIVVNQRGLARERAWQFSTQPR